MNKFDYMLTLMVSGYLLRGEANLYKHRFYVYYLTRKLKGDILTNRGMKFPYTEVELTEGSEGDYINAV